MDDLKLKFPKKLTIIVASIGIGLILLFSLFGWINGLQKQGVQREVRLSRTYETLKTGVDSYLVSAREAAGVASANAEAFDKIMLDAVSGRYQGKEGGPTTAQPGSGTLFSAIVEAYPNLDKVNENYGRIIDIITSGRTAFANNQAKLQDQIREYDQWRKSGLVHSWMVSTIIGVPSDDLVVTNETKKTGQAAYDVMSKVITSGVTADGFNTGKLEAQDFFKEQ